MSSVSTKRFLGIRKAAVKERRGIKVIRYNLDSAPERYRGQLGWVTVTFRGYRQR